MWSKLSALRGRNGEEQKKQRSNTFEPKAQVCDHLALPISLVRNQTPPSSTCSSGPTFSLSKQQANKQTLWFRSKWRWSSSSRDEKNFDRKMEAPSLSSLLSFLYLALVFTQFVIFPLSTGLCGGEQGETTTYGSGRSEWGNGQDSAHLLLHTKRYALLVTWQLTLMSIFLG